MVKLIIKIQSFLKIICGKWDITYSLNELYISVNKLNLATKINERNPELRTEDRKELKLDTELRTEQNNESEQNSLTIEVFNVKGSSVQEQATGTSQYSDLRYYEASQKYINRSPKNKLDPKRVPPSFMVDAYCVFAPRTDFMSYLEFLDRVHMQDTRFMNIPEIKKKLKSEIKLKPMDRLELYRFLMFYNEAVLCKVNKKYGTTDIFDSNINVYFKVLKYKCVKCTEQEDYIRKVRKRDSTERRSGSGRNASSSC